MRPFSSKQEKKLKTSSFHPQLKLQNLAFQNMSSYEAAAHLEMLFLVPSSITRDFPAMLPASPQNKPLHLNTMPETVLSCKLPFPSPQWICQRDQTFLNSRDFTVYVG